MGKVTALLVVCAVSFIGAVALMPMSLRAPHYAAARVEPLSGYYVFCYSTPITGFDSLGVMKIPQKFTGEPREQLSTAMNEARKKYPAANAFVFTGDNMQTAIVGRVFY